MLEKHQLKEAEQTTTDWYFDDFIHVLVFLTSCFHCGEG
jgi:hypothetical protein